MGDAEYPSDQDLPLVQQIYGRLDELAQLIRQIEVAVSQGAPGGLNGQVLAHETTTRLIMEGLGTAINDFLTWEPPAELLAQVRAKVTTRLRAWASTGPLPFHVLNTPRRSFDSFEIAELLLDNRPSGADAAALLLDHYYLNMVTVCAYRYRFAQIVRLLAEQTAQRRSPDRPVRILNLHTGAGRELAQLARNPAFASAVHLTCLDTDPLALRRLRPKLEAHLGEQVLYLRDDPRRFVAASTPSDRPYDIIYVLTLFDQLSDRQTAKLIADCYQRLRPGGLLMFGNFAHSLPACERILIAWSMNWNIRCRSDDTLRQILARTPFRTQGAACELDPFEASWLVMAVRA